jgi:integrase/recombinase XerD
MGAIYIRPKVNGAWKSHVAVQEARGVRTAGLSGPFYIRITTNEAGADGRNKQPFVKLDAETFEQAKAERERRKKGEVVAAENNAGRTPIAGAVVKFMDDKRRKTPATVSNYEFILTEFQSQLPTAIEFIDQVDRTVLNGYVKFLEDKEAAPKTINNKLMVVAFMLKHAGVHNPSKLFRYDDLLPEVEQEIAEPYTREDLKKLFDVMTDEEKVRYTFFLDTACREKEVAHATWDDVKDYKYTVRAKSFKLANGQTGKFTPKSHAARSIPLTRELWDMLEERRKESKSKWVFPNEAGDPEGHFLRKFKKIAFKAVLNCGECYTSRNEGRYEKTSVEKCCKDYSEGCEKHYLHRLRKTCATFWHTQGISLRTIQVLLAHESLETTQKYLGVQDSSEIQKAINKPKY